MSEESILCPCSARIAKDTRFERLPCLHKGTYADDCLVNRVTQVREVERHQAVGRSILRQNIIIIYTIHHDYLSFNDLFRHFQTNYKFKNLFVCRPVYSRTLLLVVFQ